MRTNPIGGIYNHMVAGQAAREQRTDRLLLALADATRRDILVRAMSGRFSVSALARAYPMSITAVQKHIAVLERARLVTRRRRGREQLVRTNPATLREVSRVLERLESLWRSRIDRMNELLLEETESPEGDCP